MHRVNRGLIKANGCVIDQGTADLEQLALTRQAEISVVLWIIWRRSAGLIVLDLVTKNRFPPPVA